MKYLALFGLLAAACAVLAQPPKAWSSVPLAKWTEAGMIDPCTEGIPPEGVPAEYPKDHRAQLPVPTPPYGTWAEANGALQATGLANCWSTRLLPGEQKNTAVTVRFTVQDSSKAARQMPGGCVRWGFHYGENLPGWDFGVVLGYKDPLNFYRVQFSAARGEMALWDANGGFLQIIPCAVEVGKTYQLIIKWQGAMLTAVLDGKTVMDYCDRTQPNISGQVGLAVWKSKVRVDQFQAAGLAEMRLQTMPAHKPNFRFEPTTNIMTEHPGFHMTPRSGIILFDGNEPVSYFWKQEVDKGNPGAYGALTQEAVKLMPGAKPVYATWIGPPGNDGGFPMLQGELPGDAFKVTGGGETITFTFQTVKPDKLVTDYTCTVRFDPRRGVYRYEYKGKSTALKDATFNEYELYDPYVYNNRTPGPEVQRRWQPAGHQWWVYQAPDDTWQRMPLVDYAGEINSDYINVTTKWGKFDDFLYPEAVACPYFENEVGWAQPQGRSYSLGLCMWGYDYHHREVGGRLTLPAGAVRPFAFTFTALPRAEADALYAKSSIPTKLQNDKTVINPFVPSGNTFATALTLQDASAQMAWLGGTRDTAVGHGDTFSLRLDGNSKTGMTLRQYMIEAYAQRWWVRGWVKTKGVGDPGLRLRIAYGGYVEDIFPLGAGDQEWTYFSAITSAFKVRDETQFHFSIPGGAAWIDDIAISALADGENPKVTVKAIEKK